MDRINWYTVDRSDRLRGNNIVDAAEIAEHAEAAMKAAKAEKDKYNKSLGSVIDGNYADNPEFFVFPNCETTPNPNLNYCSNHVERFHVGGIVK